jgi:hypothetical protein
MEPKRESVFISPTTTSQVKEEGERKREKANKRQPIM